MARLRDDVFTQQPPQRPALPYRLTAADRQFLSGVGDPRLREAQDYLWSMGDGPGLQVVETPQGRFSVGDRVEFTQPGGARIAGVLDELSASGALVSTGQGGEKALIPVEALEPLSTQRRRSEKRTEIKAALQGGGGAGCVTETRSPLPVNDGGRDFAITLQGSGGRQPSEADVMAYVAHKYPGASVLDADATHPGKLGVVIHCPEGLPRTAQGMVPLHSPAVPQSDHPESPGLHQELIEGTGKIGDGGEAEREAHRRMALLNQTGEFLIALAAANPHVDFVETSTEASGDSIVSHFAVVKQGSPMFLSPEGLSLVLRRGSAPAVGYVVASSNGMRAAMHGPKGEMSLGQVKGLQLSAAYDSMSSPSTLSREDEPGAYEHGNYVTKADVAEPTEPGEPVEADVEVEGAPPQVDPREWIRPEDVAEMQQRWYGETTPEQQAEQAKQQLQKQRRQETMREQFRQQPQQYPPSRFGPMPSEVLPTRQPSGRDLPPQQLPLERAPLSEQMPSAPTAPGWGTPYQVPEGEEELELERGPLIEQVQGDVEEDGYEHIGGPGCAVAERRAVDDKTKEYYTDLFGEDGDGYGEMLTRDIPQRRREARQMITAAFKEAGRELTATQLIAIMDVLTKKAAGPGDGGLLDKFMQARNSGAGAQIDKMVVDFLVNSPYALAQSGGDVTQLLQAAATHLQQTNPQGFEQLTKQIQKKPGLLQRVKEKFQRSPQQPEQQQQQPGAQPPPLPPIQQTRQMPIEPIELPPETTFGGQPGYGEVELEQPGPTPAQPQTQPEWFERTQVAKKRRAKDAGPQHGADDSWGRAGPTPGTYHEQSATDNYAGRRPPAKAALGFQLTNLRRRGDYAVGDVVWEPEQTKAMSTKNVEHNIISFVKGQSTMKDPIDLGNIGRVRVRRLDAHAGVAEVVFRSSEARALPPEQIIEEEGVTHHAPLS
jgi:hypothetical protein